MTDNTIDSEVDRLLEFIDTECIGVDVTGRHGLSYDTARPVATQAVPVSVIEAKMGGTTFTMPVGKLPDLTAQNKTNDGGRNGG